MHRSGTSYFFGECSLHKILFFGYSLFFIISSYTGSFSQWEYTGGPHGNVVLSLYHFNNTLIAGTDSGAFILDDKGMSWKLNGLKDSTSGVDGFTSIDSFLFACGNGIWRTSDNGTNWNSIAGTGLTTPGETSGITSLNRTLFAATYFSGIWRSDDYGETWNRINPMVDNPNRVYVVKASGSILFAAGLGYGGGLNGISVSTDSGANWKMMNLSIIAKDFIVLDSIFFACGDSGVYRSTNHGISWQQVNNGLLTVPYPIYYSNFAFSDNNLFVCSDSGVYLTKNNGENWTKVSQGLPDTSGVWCLEVHNNYLFAGMANGYYHESAFHGSGVWRRPLSDFATAVHTNTSFDLRFYVIQNPITSYADFQFDALKERAVFELFDILGRSVHREQIPTGQASLHVNMQNMPAGIYFARLGEQTVRVIKM